VRRDGDGHEAHLAATEFSVPSGASGFQPRVGPVGNVYEAGGVMSARTARLAFAWAQCREIKVKEQLEGMWH
jgi:hypothetical protein